MRTGNYVAICEKMSQEIAKNIKDPTLREWVIPGFSTTTDTEKLVGAVVLMAAMKNFFEYKISFLCGLPEVTLLGTEQDWIDIRERANRLVEFDVREAYMQQWSDMLLPILDQFVNAAQGKPNVDFWNKIAIQDGEGSGPRYLTGWITAFCFFTADGDWKGDQKGSQWLCFNVNDVPRGYVSCPVHIDDNGVEYDTELFAGHTHGRRINGTSIAPAIGWALFITE